MKTSTKRNKASSQAAAGDSILAAIRPDLIRAGMLALFCVLIWCTVYNRWTTDSWGTPIAYLPNPAKEEAFQREMQNVPKGMQTQRGRELQSELEMELAIGDVMQQFGMIKAARDGHILPVVPTNVPELGAPFVANWDDYPSTEKVIYYMMGIVAKFIGIFAAANFASLLEDVLAALSFYAACRLLKGSWIWSFAGAIIFAFARFGFAHGIHHIPTAYVWHVPLCILVFRWIIDEEGIQLRTRRFTIALIVAFCTGLQNPYNTNMFAQLVLIGTAVEWWRQEDRSQWRVCVPGVVLVGVAAAAFIFENSNTFLYHLMHGGNSGAVIRDYHWLEAYGLKLVDMVMPPPDHRFPPFAAWGFGHILPGEIVLQPGETPPTAYLGVISLASLAWLTLTSLRCAIQGKKLPVEAWLVLWIYLYASVGGLNGVIGTLGFQLFRATTRFSLWILCVLLMYAVRRMSEDDFRKWLGSKMGVSTGDGMFTYVTAAVVVFIALLDQTPPVTTEAQLRNTAAMVASDRHFAEAMERTLPEKAMVFEFPPIDFPENPTNIGSYDHMRPYLYSKELRYSFGTDKGRPNAKWQQQVLSSSASFPEFINKLEERGFAGLYVNRKSFADRGEGVIQALKSMGRDEVIQSEKGDLFCIVLKPSPIAAPQP